MASKPFQFAKYFEQQGWTPSVYTEIHDAVERSLRAAERPIAVFDFDQTCIFGDIGELFSHYLIDTLAYRYDLDEFWELIDLRDGRDRIRAQVDALQKMDPVRREKSDIYQEYLAEMGAVYGRKYAREGAAACYEWAVRLHVGMSPAEIYRLSLIAINRELQAPIGVETRQTPQGERVEINRGIRVHAEIRQLIRALERAGVDVWIVSASNRWTVEVFAQRAFGVAPQRVLGNQLYRQSAAGQPLRLCESPSDLLGSTTCLPVVYRQGKVDIIRQEVGQRPALAFGDTTTDFEMLADASELAVLIDRGNPSVRAEAQARGWTLQPQTALTHSTKLSAQQGEHPGEPT